MRHHDRIEIDTSISGLWWASQVVGDTTMTSILVSIPITIIGSDNGLSPDRCQAIIWTYAGILLIWNLGTNFSEILSKIRAFSFKKMHFKMSSAKWRAFCLGLNVLKPLGAMISDDICWHRDGQVLIFTGRTFEGQWQHVKKMRFLGIQTWCSV